MKDKEIERLIKLEEKRQNGVINLIASENYVSRDVLMALGSVFTNKYSEGYPGKRYYGGNEIVDKVENLAKERALKLFGLSKNKWSVNVQPYSGSPANLAIYLALVPIGQKIMGMSLSMGGHLTHGHKVSATGKLWKWIHFGVSKKTELLDYYEIRRIARCEKQKMIVAGFTAYPRVIDFKKLRKICDEVGAIFMVDMSHFAGLVAGGAYPPPFKYADVVTTTTHKTLRGPRGGIILTRENEEIAKKIDKSIFPGIQGGPHMHIIAAKAVAFGEAMTPKYKKYALQILKNAKTMAEVFRKNKIRMIGGGTDNHLILADVFGSLGVTGKEAQTVLDEVGMTLNMNSIAGDTRKPLDPSGIRFGTPAITTRGFKEKECKRVAELMILVLKNKDNKKMKEKVHKEIKALAKKFPIPKRFV